MVDEKGPQLNWQGDLKSVRGSVRHNSCREEEPETATHSLLVSPVHGAFNCKQCRKLF